MIENPALREFVRLIDPELILAQVWLQRTQAGYELRHIEDHGRNNLATVPLTEIRQLAMNTATGEFRPLKLAPTLKNGWQLSVSTEADLEFALNQLYPGAIADWYAARQAVPPVTHYRDYVNRQTGMYRITAMLTDAQVAGVISDCCNPQKCLKQRLWTVPTISPDSSANKSIIPCLEPCAVLMEEARKTMRAEQAKQASDTPPKVEINKLASETTSQAKVVQFGSESIQLGELDIADDVIALVSHDIAKKYRVIPISRCGTTIVLAVINPSDLNTLDALHLYLRTDIELKVASEKDITDALIKYYGNGGDKQD